MMAGDELWRSWLALQARAVSPGVVVDNMSTISEPLDAEWTPLRCTRTGVHPIVEIWRSRISPPFLLMRLPVLGDVRRMNGLLGRAHWQMVVAAAPRK